MRRTFAARCTGAVINRRGMAKRRVLLLVAIMLFLVLAFVAYRGAVRFTMDMRQRSMFMSIETALELLHNTFGKYPPSDANDVTGSPYCGAMKLAEAMMGQDLQGFHSKSVFRGDGMDSNGRVLLYPSQPDLDNLAARYPPYSEVEYANAERLADIYGKGNTGPFRGDVLVICDVFERERPSGKKIGMPILYYRADTTATLHDVNDPDNPQNVCDYKDDQALIGLGVPGKPGRTHPLADRKRFYLNTRNDKVGSTSRPYRADSYILISAGFDGLYGTSDDIGNFEWQYHRRRNGSDADRG